MFIVVTGSCVGQNENTNTMIMKQKANMLLTTPNHPGTRHGPHISCFPELLMMTPDSVNARLSRLRWRLLCTRDELTCSVG